MKFIFFIYNIIFWVFYLWDLEKKIKKVLEFFRLEFLLVRKNVAAQKFCTEVAGNTQPQLLAQKKKKKKKKY